VSDSHFNQYYLKVLRYWTVFFLLIFCFLIPMAYANDTSGKPKNKSPEGDGAIHITSDKLISDNKAGYAEFIGMLRQSRTTQLLHQIGSKFFLKKISPIKGPFL